MNEITPTSGSKHQASGKTKFVLTSNEEKISVNAEDDKVELSQSSGDDKTNRSSNAPTSDVRHDLINKFRAILDKGVYVVKAEELADKIVQKIRESKNHHLL